MPKIVNIRAYGRIHVTLIAMNNESYRINGGFGFSISDPYLDFEITSSETFYIKDVRLDGMDESQTERLKICIAATIAKYSLQKNISISLLGNLPAHSGFGSGTIIRLACLESLFILNEFKYDSDLLVTCSERGGTSGIGIRTYFDGGFVFDIGHSNFGQDLLPSSMREGNVERSLVISKGNMPEWEMGIHIPVFNTAPDEALFFKQHTKIENQEIYKTNYHVLYGLVGGVLDSKIETFEFAINAIQKCKWKASEIALYAPELSILMQVLRKEGAVSIGMSSLGPSLFFTSRNTGKTIQNMNRRYPGSKTFTVLPRNSGREINVVYA